MPDHSAYELRRIESRSTIRLRVRPNAAEAAMETLELPANCQCTSGSPAKYWLSPDQWLLASDSLSAAELLQQLESELGGQLYLAIDLSSGLACFSMKGPAARILLAMGCGVDMHPSAFRSGQCVRTRFANVALVIAAVGKNSFELFVDRSLAGYLEEWIAAASEDPLAQKSRRAPSTQLRSLPGRAP